MTLATNVRRDHLDPLRILVADADGDMRCQYRDSLGPSGFEVVDAEDGRDALVSALAHPPALVITETRLPMLDGYALCEILRSDSMTHTVPILVVTHDTSPAELDRVRVSAADAVLPKPVTPHTLLTEIQRLLKGRPKSLESARSIPAPAPGQPANARRRRAMRARAYRRAETATPPTAPPSLVCPTCDRQLRHERSYVGGVANQLEQWDDYRCPASCGTFEYRHRTRKLRGCA